MTRGGTKAQMHEGTKARRHEGNEFLPLRAFVPLPLHVSRFPLLCYHRRRSAMAIKFEIFRDGKRLTNFAPVGAIAIGPESVPIPGEVAFRDGHLIVDKTDDH